MLQSLVNQRSHSEATCNSTQPCMFTLEYELINFQMLLLFYFSLIMPISVINCVTFLMIKLKLFRLLLNFIGSHVFFSIL